MSSTWLLLDANNLAYRTFHSMPRLSHRDVLTSVVYGMLRDVANWQDRFQTNNVAFCFDVGWPIRHSVYPRYKQKRRDRYHERPAREIKLQAELIDQINNLRIKYLPTIGYRNILWQDKYEADDIIASVCHNLGPHQKAIIISEDQDLYQLLDRNVSIYLPRKQQRMTVDRFRNLYEMSPRLWARAKAIAGCSSDDVTGVVGVGMKTACAYLRGDLKEDSTKYEAIKQAVHAIEQNLTLVDLPFAGTKIFDLKPNKVTKKRWRRFCKLFSLKSLRNHAPLARRYE